VLLARQRAATQPTITTTITSAIRNIMAIGPLATRPQLSSIRCS
jgi:hypothetical protein